VGASLNRVPGNSRVHFSCDKFVTDRFEQMNQEEITRRNSPNMLDSEREWAEKSRYEFRVMKECLILAYSDAGACVKNTVVGGEGVVGDGGGSSSNGGAGSNGAGDFALESRAPGVASEAQALHGQKQMQALAVVTKAHLAYAEHYIGELDRADKANADDYNPDDIVLIGLIEEYCHRIFNKKVEDMPKLYLKKMGGSKKAEMFFKSRIVSKLMLTSDNSSKMMKHVAKMCKSSSVRDAHRIMENAFRSGESEGRWVFVKAGHVENVYRVDYVRLPEN